MKGQNIASTLIFNKEQEKNRERHIHQILNVKISVPSSQKNIVKENRKKFNHLSNNRKRQQLEELRITEIERENRILLEKMTSIVKEKRKLIKSKPKYVSKLGHQNLKLQEIQDENFKFKNRLESKQSHYKVADFTKNFKNHQKYAKNISNSKNQTLKYNKNIDIGFYRLNDLNQIQSSYIHNRNQRPQTSNSSSVQHRNSFLRSGNNFNSNFSVSNNNYNNYQKKNSSNNILGDYDKNPSPSLRNKAQSTRGMRNFSNQNKIRSQTTYSQDFRQKMQLLYKNVRKIDGENYLVEIKVFQNKMVIKCDIIKGFESKIIEIPEDEAQDFLRVECNNQLENMISKLKIIDNKMYLIGNQADPNKIQTNRSNKYDEEQNILVNNNKLNLKNQKNQSKVGKDKNLNDELKNDIRQSKQLNVKNIKDIEINQDIIKLGQQDLTQSQQQQPQQNSNNNNLNSYQIQQNSSQRKSTKFNNNNSKIVEGQAGQLKVQTQEDYDEQFDEAETEKQFNSLEEQEILEQLKMHNKNQIQNKDSENDIKTDFAKKTQSSKMERSQLNASRNLNNNSILQQQEVDLDQSSNRIQKDGSKFVQNEKIRQNQIKQQKQNERKIRDQKIQNMYNKTVEGQKNKQKQSSNQQTSLNSQQQRTNQFEEDNDNYYHDNIKDEKLQSIVQ